MTSKAGTALDYGTTSPKHAVKSHGTTTYTYDANGSMTAKGTQTIKYDPEQRPIRGPGWQQLLHRAAYDGDGVRRKRDDSNGTVHYLGGYERKLAGGSNSSDTVTKYYSASLRGSQPAGGLPPGRDAALGGLGPPWRHDQGYGQQLHRSGRDALQALRRG